ncbi:MAG: hypothetical protein AB8G11_05225 [Saprospiraceae bacterium]
MKTQLIFLLLLFSFVMNAQESDEIQNYRIIKYSPTNLMNPFFPSIQFSFEHNIGERQALQYELGGIYLRSSSIVTNAPLFTHSTLVEYRWYRKSIDFGPNKFQGVGLRFQKQYSQNVELHIENGLLELTTSFSTIGVYYTRGLLRQYEKISLEFGGRVGGQYVDYSVYNIPDGMNESTFTENSNFIFNLFPTGQFIPMGHLFFKVGFGWKSE